MSIDSITEKLSRLEAIGGTQELAALELVLAERIRQVEGEGYTPAHDDEQRKSGQLAAAGACYLLAVHHQNVAFVRTGQMVVKPSSPHPSWPFSRVIWKPASPTRMATKGTALGLAELVRHLRAALP